MYSDHVAYYHEALKPQFEAYRSTSLILPEVMGRLEMRNTAMQSANSLFHIRDYLTLVIGDHFTRNYVGNLFPDYHLIGDVFNASKHPVLNRKDKLIIGEASIIEGVLTSRFVDQGGNYHNQQAVIFIKPIKGAMFDMMRPATNVYNYWTKFLFERGDIPFPEYIRYGGDDIVSRANATEPSPLVRVRLEARPGVAKKNFQMIVREYDYEKNEFIYGE